MVSDMQQGRDDVGKELRGSTGFVMGVLVSGAMIFAVLFNLCYLAVEYDVRLQRAYLALAHAERLEPAQISQAIRTLDELLPEDVRGGGRPVLCESDIALIDLYPKLSGADRQLLGELLSRKTGSDSDWEMIYLEKLPTARSPFQMPFLELSMLYYGWVIEIATLIFLSQSLQKPHVQEFLYRAVLKPWYFLPLSTPLLFVPIWTWANLIYPRAVGWWACAGLVLLSLAMAVLWYRTLRRRLTPAKMNEMGFHLLISSLFVQLLTVMGDPDVVYSVFAAERMTPVRYGTWFILLCIPGLLLEKLIKASREEKEPDELPVASLP